MIKKSIQSNPAKFYCSVSALIIGIIGLILYLATGVIKGFTDQYSTALIIVAVVGIIANVVFSVKRVDTLEMIPFMAYVISIFLFIAVNANYLAAVVRAIDISRVSTAFIMTIVCFLVAAAFYLAGFCFKVKEEP